MSDESKRPGEQTGLALSDELAIRKAETDATIQVVEAVGAQLRAIAESPGVQEVLKGLGQTLEKRAQQAVDAQQHAHELQKQANDLAAQRERRRDYLGAGLLVFIAVMIVCGVWLVTSGTVDTKNMLAAVSLIAAVLTGRFARPQ